MDSYDCTQRLVTYFTSGLGKSNGRIGMEVETSFVDGNGKPIMLATSQNILSGLVETGWEIVAYKSGLITELRNADGDRMLYELGRQNIELATRPDTRENITSRARTLLAEVYAVAQMYGAFPLFAPIVETDEDLLVIPDERDATWLDLDGREALKPLATISSVQFTIDVTLASAIPSLNKLGGKTLQFLADYPQDAVWQTYMRESKAGYRVGRYGAGYNYYYDLRNYCETLALQEVVTSGGLISHALLDTFDVGLFVRSVWWYFRLRRYGDQLAIEVRPLPRRTDADFDVQLAQVLSALES